MTPRELNERLVANIDSVLAHLLPNGKVIGPEYCVGDLSGGSGKSLKVHLKGPKAGMWCDFATGIDKGDLLGLWCSTKNITLSKAMEAAKDWLGISSARDLISPISNRKYQANVKPKQTAKPVQHGDTVQIYFERRGITLTTLQAFNVLTQDGSVAVFQYVVDGQNMLIKYRDVASKEKKIWASDNSTPVLFGWQTIPDKCREVVICEGEPDAMTWFEHGFACLSVPFGGGSKNKQAWIENEYDRLERFDIIYLSMDMDKEGIAARDEIINRLGNHRCKVIFLPKKDANECHVAGLDLCDYYSTAKTIDPQELKNAAVYTDDVINEFYSSDERHAGLTMPWSKASNMRFRRGELTIWTGISGHGKTMLLDHITIHGIAKHEKFLLASMEMRPSVHLKRLVSQATTKQDPLRGDISKAITWMSEYLWFVAITGTAKAERLLTVMDYAYHRYGITQFVVDSLSKCGFDEDDYNGQKAFVDRLTDFGREHNVHVHLVCHSRKGDDEHRPPGKMDVKGTGSITDMADNVITVWRNKAKEADVEASSSPSDSKMYNNPDCVLIVSKQRNYDWEGKVKIWYDRISHQYLQEQNSRPVNYIQEAWNEGL